MSFDPNKLLNWKFPEVEHAYTEKDTILYALGLGCGSDGPLTDDLKFVYEKGLVALPMMAVVLASPGNWLGSKESGVDYSKVLHGEQYLTLHRPLPPAADYDRSPPGLRGSAASSNCSTRARRRAPCSTQSVQSSTRRAGRRLRP